MFDYICSIHSLQLGLQFLAIRYLSYVGRVVTVEFEVQIAISYELMPWLHVKCNYFEIILK